MPLDPKLLSPTELTRLGIDILAIEHALPVLEKMARIKLHNASPGADKAMQRISKLGRQLRGEE